MTRDNSMSMSQTIIKIQKYHNTKILLAIYQVLDDCILLYIDIYVMNGSTLFADKCWYCIHALIVLGIIPGFFDITSSNASKVVINFLDSNNVHVLQFILFGAILLF